MLALLFIRGCGIMSRAVRRHFLCVVFSLSYFATLNAERRCAFSVSFNALDATKNVTTCVMCESFGGAKFVACCSVSLLD